MNKYTMKHTKPVRHNIRLNCYEIDLTQGQTTLIDLRSYWVLEMYNFFADWCRNKKNYYVKYGHIVKQLHRLLFNFPEGFQINHKNGNTLDNRLQNLEICTSSQNCRDMKTRQNNIHPQGVNIMRQKGKPINISARIRDNSGERLFKSFSINKYGYHQAKYLAIAQRKTWEQLYDYSQPYDYI